METKVEYGEMAKHGDRPTGLLVELRRADRSESLAFGDPRHRLILERRGSNTMQDVAERETLWLGVRIERLIDAFGVVWTLTERDVLIAEENRLVALRATSDSRAFDLAARLKRIVDRADTAAGQTIADMWVWALACSRQRQSKEAADSSFTAFARCHQQRLARALELRCRVASYLAEELAFEACSRMWHKYWSDDAVRLWEPRTSAHSFLLTIAYNELVSRSRKRFGELAGSTIDGSSLRFSSRDRRTLELDEVVRVVLAAARKTLRGRQAQIFELAVVRGMKGVAIAEQLGVSPTFVSRELKKANERVTKAVSRSLGSVPGWVEDIVDEGEDQRSEGGAA